MLCFPSGTTEPAAAGVALCTVPAIRAIYIYFWGAADAPVALIHPRFRCCGHPSLRAADASLLYEVRVNETEKNVAVYRGELHVG